MELFQKMSFERLWCSSDYQCSHCSCSSKFRCLPIRKPHVLHGFEVIPMQFSCSFEEHLVHDRKQLQRTQFMPGLGHWGSGGISESRAVLFPYLYTLGLGMRRMRPWILFLQDFKAGQGRFNWYYVWYRIACPAWRPAWRCKRHWMRNHEKTKNHHLMRTSGRWAPK